MPSPTHRISGMMPATPSLPLPLPKRDIQQPQDTVTPNNGFIEARQSIKQLVQQMNSFEIESHGWHAYQQAVFAKFDATIGITAFNYHGIELTIKLLNQRVEYMERVDSPPEAALSVRNDLYSAMQTFKSVELELTDADNDESDWVNDVGGIQQALSNVQDWLRYMIKSDLMVLRSEASNNRQNDVLASVHRLVRARIGFHRKVDILNIALVCWPPRQFDPDLPMSKSLKEFVAAHYLHVWDMVLKKATSEDAQIVENVSVSDDMMKKDAGDNEQEISKNTEQQEDELEDDEVQMLEGGVWKTV